MIEPWAQWEVTATVNGVTPQLLVLVVDDGPSVDAVALRESLREALRVTLRRLDGLTPRLDPAAWQPTDWTVVIALPSQQGSARFVGPPEVPSLGYRRRSLSSTAIDALVDTVGDEQAARVAPAGAPYRPLETARDAVRLLMGLRAPTDAREAALLDATSRTAPRVAWLAMATTRDDESPLPAADYTLPPSFSERDMLFVSVLAPSPETEPCIPLLRGDELSTPRIGAWVDSVVLPGFVSAPRGWPCSADSLNAHGFPPMGVVDSNARDWCSSHPIATRPNGAAECLVTAEHRVPADGCDAERGWRDPIDADGVRRERARADEDGAYRICEVAQLEATALAACRTDAACPGCGSGWCRTALNAREPGDAGYDWCSGWFSSRLRFVGGAMARANARFRILCDLDVAIAPGAGE